MAGKFTLITGMWRRRKGTGNESYHYGKTKQALVLPKGTEIYLFESSARNPSSGEPQKFLKAKTPEGVELVQEL